MPPGAFLFQLSGQLKQQVFTPPGGAELHAHGQTVVVQGPWNRHRWRAGEVGQLGERGAVQIVEGELLHQTAAAQHPVEPEPQNQLQRRALPPWRRQLADASRRLRAGGCEVEIEAREQLAQRAHRAVPARTRQGIVARRKAASDQPQSLGVRLESRSGHALLLPPGQLRRHLSEVHRQVVARQLHAVAHGVDPFDVMPQRLQQLPAIRSGARPSGIDRAADGRSRAQCNAQPLCRRLQLLRKGPGRRLDDERIARLRACDDIEQGRTVAHRAGNRMGADGSLPLLIELRRTTHPPTRRFEPEQTAISRRNTDRPSAVSRSRRRHNTRSHRSRGTPRRAAGCVVEIPRIARRPKRHRLGDGLQAQLRRIGLAENQQPGLLPPPHDRVGLRHWSAGQRSIALAGTVPGQIHAQVLEQKRNTRKRGVPGARVLQPGFGVLAQISDDGIDSRIDRITARDGA